MKKIIKYIIYILMTLWVLVLFFVLVNKYIYREDIYSDYISSSKHKLYNNISESSQSIVDKIIYIEDRNFYHNVLGLDISRIFKSIYNNIINDKIQWASTIDQQLVKILHSNYTDRNIYNKILEIFGAINLNLNYSKDEILLAYINNLPMTNNIVWIQAACDIYFTKNCNNLTESEQYFLISIYQLWISPYNQANFDKIKNRSKFLCDNFGGIDCQNIYEYSPKSYLELSKYTLSINPIISSYLQSYPSTKWSDNIYNQTQNIINNLKPHLQNNGVGDCCVVILDGDGDVVSMNVCRSSQDKTPWANINICLSKRQTGSAIKPFLYILWMHKLWLDADSIIVDEPVTYYLDNSNEYNPKNFDLKYHGEVSIAQALGSSLNIPAIKILHDVGLIDFENWILSVRKVYKSDNIYNLTWADEKISQDHKIQLQWDLWLSMALGTYSFSALEFANLRRIFLVKWFSDDLYNIYQYQKQINVVYDILSNFNNRNMSFGVDNWLNLEDWASKSGTSRHFVDGWTCGVSRKQNNIVCVRVGNHDNKPAQASSSQTASLLRNLVAKSLSSVTK